MKNVTKVLRSEDSIPWLACDRQLVPIFLDNYNYLEEEYFYSGKGNIYSLQNGVGVIKEGNAPYTNRFIMRKPKDSTKFSGNVVIEILNATNGWDVSPMWSLVWPEILKNGDVYVGMTSRSVCIESLKQYDMDRYKNLSWRNPNPSIVNDGIFLPKMSTPQNEDGFIWDALHSLGELMKSTVGKDIIGASVKGVYVMGCSQSAMKLSTFINTFHETTRPSLLTPVFDGYLQYSGCVMVSLNQEEPMPSIEDEIQQTHNCPSPIIRCMSQWDFKDFAGHLKLRRKDNDHILDRFRLYEMAGHAHNSFVGAFYRPGVEELKQIGKKASFPATDFGQLPLDYVMQQMLRNLIEWSENKSVPSHAPSLIQVDKNGLEVLDENLNCKGGFRFPQLDVPIATYCSGTKYNDMDSCFIPFSEEKLKLLYPTREDYVYKIFKKIDDMAKNRFISIENADKMKLDILKQPIPSMNHSSK